MLWKDSTGAPIPWLATDWERSPDGLEWRFTLREGVTWQDGRPLTADDVVFTFDYLTNGPGKANPGVFGPVPGMQVVAADQRVVVFRLPSPIAPFEVTVAGRVPIIPKHIWSEVADPVRWRDPRALIGSGPYRLESLDEATGSYLFSANDSYFLGPPVVRRLEFVPAADPLVSLLRDGVDTAGPGFEQGVPEGLLDRFDDPRFGTIDAPGEVTTAVHFNLARGFPYNDRNFRHAVAYAVDRKDLVKRILLGRGEPGSLGGLAPSNAFAASGLPSYDRDIARSRALLDQIGLRDVTGDGMRDLPNGSPFVAELLTTPRWNPKTADLTKEHLREVGIDVRITSADYPAFNEATSDAKYDMALIAYGGMGGDPDFLRTRLSSQVKPRVFSRVHGYVNPRFDELAGRQLTIVDTDERKRVVQEMQRIVAEDVPTIPLYLADRTQIFVRSVFDQWYFTPGGVFGGYPGVLNKHVFVTGKKAGF